MNPTREQYVPLLERGKKLLKATEVAEYPAPTRKRCSCGFRIRGINHGAGAHHAGNRKG